MSYIKIMDDHLANKIAAGEVVEKCSSVVKELVENSIDALAKVIKIELIESGTKMIRVTDDGKGMDKIDAKLAFLRHATSKLLTENDLFEIRTLGFRGEALPSIASVSEVILNTSDSLTGTYIHINGGKIIEEGDAPLRKGTVISVNNLFYNTPARLKHMKSLYSELASITDYVNKIALSHPDIKFILINDGEELLNTDGKGDLLKVIFNIYGLEISKKMIPVDVSNNDYHIYGYISKPEINKSSRNYMTTIVNKRVVRNTELNRVIDDSYHSYKPENRYPVVVLNIDVDPSLIDVNIHPTKMDIKFSLFDDLLNLIGNEIKQLLREKPLMVEKQVITEKPVFYEELKLDLDRVEEPSFNETKQIKRLPEIYPEALIHGTYIIGQNELGMYIIDQHAAKERINYELYKEKLGNPSKKTISPLIPIVIEIANNDYIILNQNISLLNNIGYEVEEIGINSIVVKRHPVWLPVGYEEEATNRIIDLIISKEKDFSIERFNESIAIMLSCKMSIKANQNITKEEMEHLIDDLRGCENPYNCPHGRPTIIFYSNEELEREFKRQGF